MAAAIPAAIGVGSSLIGGISGKGARKAQERLAQQQLQQLQPLINAQIMASQFGLDQARNLYPLVQSMLGETFSGARKGFDTGTRDYESLLGEARGRSGELFDKGNALLEGSTPYLKGAGQALAELQKFYRPFMTEGNAIDRFLPSKQRTDELLAPEFGQINEGYQATLEGLSEAPRGGGRASAFNKANMARQSDLSKAYFTGRQALGDRALNAAFQSAGGEGNRANSLMNLGLGQGQLGLGTIGAGNQTLGTGGGLAMNSFGNALQALGIGGGAAGNLGNLATTGLGIGSSGGQGAMSLYNSQANRAYGGSPSSGGSGNQLGGFLVDLFSNKGVQDKVGGFFGGLFGGGKNSNILPGTDFNYGYGQGG